MRVKGIAIYTDDELDIIQDVKAELDSYDPVKRRFLYISFVSASKGRGRRRKRPVEVELVNDVHEPSRWVSFNKLKFDTLATEVYVGSDGEGLEAKLQRDLRNVSSLR